MIPEEKLISGCREGKRSSQSELYKRFSSKMFSVCLRYARNRAEAEDLLQDGFIKVFQHIGSFRQEGSLEGWIRRIMVNTSVNHYHSSMRQQFILVENMQEVMDETDQEPFDDHIQDIQLSPEQLVNLVQELPDGYRTVLNLYVFEGYSHNDIAQTLQIAENTSKSQLSKARKYMRKLLEKKFLNNHIILSNHEK